MAFSFITRFLGRTTSEAAGFALGGAMRRPVDPPLQELTNNTWKAFVAAGVTVPVETGAAAEVVAEDVEQDSWGKEQAAQMGIGGEQFDALVGAARSAPQIAVLFDLRRRGKISDADLVHGFRKARLETRWDADLKALLEVLLTPSELANARQQGFIDEGRQKSEAALQGITDDRAEIQFELAGLPPGVDVMQRAVNRGLADQGTFTQAIREGHTKVKYTDLLWQMRHPLLSAATYVRLFLKGWISRDEMNAGGALWGYQADQMNLWYQSEGRPATTHQIHIGYARGATVPGAANEEEAIRDSVKRSDIRPEYADVLYASRYTLPSAFALRGLVESGAITAARGEEILVQSGWPPDLAKEVADSWAGSVGGAPKPDPHIAKAQTQLWTTLHTSYLEHKTDDARALLTLAEIGVAAGARDDVLRLWKSERDLIRAFLSSTQIKKATVEPYATADEKTAALVEKGYSETDASVLVQE